MANETLVSDPVPSAVNGVTGVSFSNGYHTDSVPTLNTCAIPLNDKTAYAPRKLRVVTIGAGFSGLMMAHKFQHRFPEMQNLVSHTIFEARHDLGGTWLCNTYPGVQCDVPSHIYAFPFDPNPDWDNFYASGADIHEYIGRTAKKWNLDRDVQLNTHVTGAFWQEDLGQWKLIVENEGQSSGEYADVLISGQGVLNTWKWPSIPGLHDFKGQIVHSAAWDHTYDYSHKRIAVIGNGSSGIQILPQMAKLPGTDVTNFQRGPSWIYYRIPPSKHLGRGDLGSNPAYTEEQKKMYRENPLEHQKYRKQMIHRTNTAFRMFVKGSQGNIEGMQYATQQMSEKLQHDPELCAKLIPKWELGCRRITPGEGFLESFLRPNVHLTQSPITKITQNAIHTANGTVHEVDTVICATGFDVSYCPTYPIIGRKAVSLAEKWADEPESYLSVACSDMPNYFTYMGPNAVIGHGSLMEGLNWTGDYMVKWIRKIATEDIKSVVPLQSAVDELVRYGDEIQKTLVWTGGCKSWYKKGRVDGRVTATFAGSALLYKQMISEIRAEDFDIRYKSPNRFRFMSNGFTEYESEDGNDLAWYTEK